MAVPTNENIGAGMDFGGANFKQSRNKFTKRLIDNLMILFIFNLSNKKLIEFNF
jgi:hypothetical protein